MTKFNRGTQKVHGKLSKLSLGYIKGIPFLYFQSKGTEKVQKKYKILCLFCTLFRCGTSSVSQGKFIISGQIIAEPFINYLHLNKNGENIVKQKQIVSLSILQF